MTAAPLPSSLPPLDADTVCASALELLETLGGRFADSGILAALSDHGAAVDFEAQRARLRSPMVADALREASEGIALHSRDGAPLQIGRPHVCFSNSTYDMWVLDYESGERHRSTQAHVEQFVRLEDALHNIDIVGAQVVPQNAPEPLRQIRAAEALLKHTRKPFVMNLFNADEGAVVLDMVEAAQGGSLCEAPRLLVGICPDSPLRFEKCVTDVMRLCAERGVPMGIGPCPILGASAPITPAGALVQTVAEALAGLTLVKTLNPDCPVYLGTTPFAMASQGNLLMAAPECYVVSWGYAQVCERLGVPSSFSCTHTNSVVPTMQTGYEKMAGLMLALLSGSPLVQVPAVLDDGATTSFEQHVIESDALDMAKRLAGGIDVSEETVALDVIRQGAARGNFLDLDHTVENLRAESWLPSVFFRGAREQLGGTGATAERNASERVRELLEEHEPEPLPDEATRAIDGIVGREVARVEEVGDAKRRMR